MAFLTPVLLLVAAVAALVFLFYKKNYRFWKNHGFPYATPSIPWGNIQGMGTTKNIGVAIEQVYKDHPSQPFVGMWLMFRPGLLIRDPELIKSVFVRDFMYFHDRGIYINEKDDPLSAHLFNLAGSKWRNLRMKLTPTFTSGKMKLMFPIFLDCGKNLVSTLEGPARNGEIVEIKEYCACFTTEIISMCAFGIETNCLHDPDSDFRRYGQKIFEPTLENVFRLLIQTLLPNLAKLIKIRAISKDVEGFFIQAFRETMDYREKNNVRRNDFMDLLIQLKNKGKIDDSEVGDNPDSKEAEKFTFEEAAAQAFVFFFAGFETSSTTMQYVLYELARNPDCQQKARDEIKTVLLRHNGKITYECLAEMEYLSRVIDEALRLYPPVPVMIRESSKPYKIPGTDLILPGGTEVLIDCFALHHDSKYYPNPGKFDPHRFTEEEKAKRHHYAYLPFGEGPRNCIGMRFGLMQTKVGLISLINNYSFSICDKTTIPMEFDPKVFVLTPKYGMHLKIDKII